MIINVPDTSINQFIDSVSSAEMLLKKGEENRCFYNKMTKLYLQSNYYQSFVEWYVICPIKMLWYPGKSQTGKLQHRYDMLLAFLYQYSIMMSQFLTSPRSQVTILLRST